MNKRQQRLLKDLEFFKKLFKEAKRKYSFDNTLIIHGDMSPKNTIFHKDKVVGVIDFEVIKIAPRTSDLQYLVKDISYVNNEFNRRRYDLFIKEYSKINKLRGVEVNRLPFMMLLNECEAYIWVINHLENKEDFEYCQNIAKRTKTMIRAFHDKFKNSKIIELI